MENINSLKIRHQVYNKKTGEIIGDYGTRKRASTKRDKMDNEYGAYVHGIREVLK